MKINRLQLVLLVLLPIVLLIDAGTDLVVANRHIHSFETLAIISAHTIAIYMARNRKKPNSTLPNT